MQLNTGFEGTQRRYDTGAFDKHVLQNGVTIWLQKPTLLTDEEGILIAFYPLVGSIQDPAGKEGLAHFFEHIPFRGTTTRPSKKLLVGPVDENGGQWNGVTNKWRTKYFVRLQRDMLPLAAETVFEMATAPLMREADVLVERGVISQEYHTQFKDGEKLAGLHMIQKMFGSHPLAHFPLGHLGTIDGICVDDLSAFQKQFYTARNLHVVCGGAFTERDDVLAIIENTFGSLPVSGQPTILPSPIPECSTSEISISDVRYGRDSSLLIWLVLAPENQSGYPIALLGNAVCNGSSTPLVTAIREELGLTYDTQLLDLAKMPPPYPWMISIGARLDEKHFGTLHDLTREHLRRLSEKRIIVEHRRAQFARRNQFTHPVTECEHAVEDITLDGRTTAYRELEDLQDTTTLDEIFGWRDYLLSHEPTFVRITAK